MRKRVAQQAREGEIEAMPERGADAAAQKHNETGGFGDPIPVAANVVAG